MYKNITKLILIIGLVLSLVQPVSAWWIPSHSTTDITLNNLFGGNITGENIGGVIYADQYASIQDAINNANSGDKIFIPNGIYSGTIDLTGKYGLVLECESNTHTSVLDRGSLLYLPDSTNDYIIKADNLVADYYDLTIRNCGLNGNKNNNPTGKSLMFFNNTYGLHIENNRLSYGKSNGIELKSVRWAWIVGNYIGEDSAGNDGHGILIDGLSPGWILDNNILFNDVGVYLKSDGSPATEDVKIIGNAIVRNTGYGIRMDKGANLFFYNEIASNSINENIKDGIYIYGTVTATNIHDNYIISNNFSGSATQYNGISLIGDAGIGSGARNTTIKNNLFAPKTQNSTKYAIQMWATNNTIIESNNVEDQVTGGIEILADNVMYTIKNNYGASPYHHGNLAAATTFGAGDTYFDTDLNYMCVYNGTAYAPMNANSGACT